MPIITAIITPNVKSGEGSRGYWQQDLVQLDDGQEVRMFTPYEVGDEIESYESESNGKTYTNWRLVNGTKAKDDRPKTNTSKGGITTDQIYAVVCEQNKLLKAIAEIVGVDIETVAPTAPVKQPKAPRAKLPKAPNGAIDDTPINLDDIPF